MFAFDIAPLLIFPGLGLVALALGLLSRRYSRSAFVVGLAGLFAITTGSMWITTAGPMKVVAPPPDATFTGKPNSPTEVKDPGAAPAGLPTPIDPVQPINSEIESLKNQLALEQTNRAEAEKRASRTTEKFSELEGMLARTDQDLRKTQKERATAVQELDALKLELERVKSAPPALPPPPATPDPEDIRRKLESGHPQYYVAEPESGLISGMEGTWYSVQLRQAGKSWNFDDRQFVLADAAEIKASVSRLRDDVLIPLSKSKTDWRLFVRGAADARPVSGPVAREVAYLPRLPDGTHAPNSTPRRVPIVVQNQELPILRADWLREVIRPLLANSTTAEIEILENPPQPEHDRTAELVLWVNW